MTWVGRLDGTVDGRPFAFLAEGQDGLLRLGGFALAWQLRRLWPQVGTAASGFLARSGLELRAKVAFLPALRVAPRPFFALRWLLPG